MNSYNYDQAVYELVKIIKLTPVVPELRHFKLAATFIFWPKPSFNASLRESIMIRFRTKNVCHILGVDFSSEGEGSKTRLVT